MKIPFYEQIKAIPVIRPLFLYILGWLSGYLYPESLTFNSQDFMHFFLLLNLISFLLRKYFIKWTQIALVLFSFLLFGNFQGKRNVNPDYNPKTDIVYLSEVVDTPIEKNKTTLLKLKLIYCFTDSLAFEETIFVNSYFEKTGEIEFLPEPGEHLIIKSRLVPVKNNGNPYEFNYAKWLKRKNIFFTSYVKSENWQSLGIKNETFLYKCKSFREFVKNKIVNFFPGEFQEEKAVLVAITLGSKELLESGIKSDFADAGAIHVMAVSGLHVGLIWMFIGFLTGFLKSTFTGRIIQFFLITTLLWTYASITGMSPSVTRSCLMFSLVSFGNLILRDSSVYNTVLLSAFIQLLINPILLLDVGFQFSYAAVLSILFFQPLLKKLLISRSVIMNWFLDLISVSIAAQIFTFPLAIFYFHQFPIYFIFSNILVIPLVTILMMIFICSICFIMVPLIYDLLLSILIFFSSLLIKSVNLVTSLPFSTAEGLNINLFQMFLLLFFALLLLIFIHHKKLIYIKLSVATLMIFFCFGIYRFGNKPLTNLMIFNVPNTLAVDIIIGENHYLIHNLESENISKDLNYYTDNYWIRTYSNTPEFIHIDSLENYHMEFSYQQLPGKNNSLITLGKKNIIFIGDCTGIFAYKGELMIDSEALLIFDPNLNSSFKEQKIFNSGKIIISPSCNVYSSWFKFVDDHYYFVKESGAVGVEIK
ncbi:MAG: ComEC family competence protein [Bacteroidales bacterium]|nr:ComEC family competence protein [Bacteroidales bacterium]